MPPCADEFVSLLLAGGGARSIGKDAHGDYLAYATREAGIADDGSSIEDWWVDGVSVGPTESRPAAIYLRFMPCRSASMRAGRTSSRRD